MDKKMKMSRTLIMVMVMAITRQFTSVSRKSSLVVRAWSFLPSTRSRSDLLGTSTPIRKSSINQVRRNLKSTLVMWGEEDTPRWKDKRVPASTFSSDANQQQRRPARRSRRSSSGWDDDSDNDAWGEEFNPDQRRQKQARQNDNNWDDRYDRDSSYRGGQSRVSSSGWDDDYDDNFDAGGYNSFEPYTYDGKSSSRNQRGGGRGNSRRGGERGGRGRGRGGRGDRRDRGGRGGNGRTDARQRRGSDNETKPSGGVKINLKLLENAGYEHLYGISPVLNALKANQRNFANPDDEDEEDLNDLLELQERLSTVDGIDNEFSMALEDELMSSPDEKNDEKREIKPEAKLAPYLFVQEGTLDNTKRSFRSDAKIQASSEIVALAKEHGVPLAEVDKGVLNTLCGNRPHQGFVLRCGGLNFEQLRSIPSAVGEDAKSNPRVWLALDEVVDPQNLGALLRSIYFLGGGEGVGVLVTAKNSSPLSPTVSASSSGALEFMTVYSTSNLPKMLNSAKDNGWRVLGAAAEAPTDKRRDDTGGNDWDIDVEDDGDGTTQQQQQQKQQCYDLNDVETQKPTILVLGSEGRGLRTLVARACSSFVKIPGGVSIDDGDDSQAGVDSLNVSVTGGILLWHFLSGSRT